MVAHLLLALVASIPSDFHHPLFEQTVWIAGERAVLSDAEKALLQKHRVSGGECDAMFFGRVEDGSDLGAASSWQELRKLATTRTVFEGTVTATAVGVRAGLPYAVLRIERSDSTAPVFLLYPDARLELDGMTICNRDSSYAPRPDVGDPIVFVGSIPVDASGTLYHVAGAWILYEHHGAIVTGPGLRNDAEVRRFASIREIAAALR